MLDALRREGAFSLQRAADGRSAEWHGTRGDGSVVVVGEPEVGRSRRLLLGWSGRSCRST